ncbi:MAG: hypothetical protein AAF517_19810, partial [Planctomycetota bacterium]
QRRALAFDESYLPAKMQLCQDLLRLGEEEEGWRLASEVYEADAYNVVAHNLSTLHDHIKGFRSLRADGVVVRMEAREAEIYGAAVLKLLSEARDVLCKKYAVTIDEPIIVEIFPEQKDFAIRTFGLPGGVGFLGVCFGTVITANSPASQTENPSNWEAVLWHEFCHVITLSKTKNRMPRWLSEGISVYEEKLRNPVWGQTMTPQYLDLIEDSGVTPVSELSAAFLHAPSPLHTMFAYYHSSLVVECLVEKHGIKALHAILDDLANGTLINAAIDARTGGLEQFEKDVAAFVDAKANELRESADWSGASEIAELSDDDLEAFVEANPKSYWARRLLAERRLASERRDEGLKALESLVSDVPNYTGPGTAYAGLAQAYRKSNETALERDVLERWAARTADSVSAFLRAVELAEDAEDWKAVVTNADRLLSVNPLLRAPHRALARAMEKLGTPVRAESSYRALLAMNPVDPAGLYYQLGRVLREQGRLEEAKLSVLKALEEAPRYRAAHRELLAIARELKSRKEASK